MEDFRQFYATQSIMTDPEEYGSLFNDLPEDIPTLCKIIQLLILHFFWAETYGEELSEERYQERHLRRLSRQLKRIIELDDNPLTVPRYPNKRVVGTCRDYSVFLTAMLRHQGIPARARCGFGTYFQPGKGEDHWVCQYYQVDDERWVMVDAQIDQVQRYVLKIEFDTLDMSEGLFLPAGKAWQMCRAGEADPDNFGIQDLHGMWFIAGDLIRDLLSLNKIELLPWDGWGLITGFKQFQELSPEQLATYDHIAELTLTVDGNFSEVRSFYENEVRLRPAPDWEP